MNKTVLRYVIAAVVGLAIVAIIVLAKNVFAAENMRVAMQIWCDAFFASGVFLSCAGLIVVVSNGGVFDMLAYSMTVLFATIRSSRVERKYKTYYDYRESKKDKKSNISFLLVTGIVLILISFVFLGVYESLN